MVQYSPYDINLETCRSWYIVIITLDIVYLPNFFFLKPQVGSHRCNYGDMKPAALVKRHEDANHFGGYFIVNGNEKVMRMLQV